jgi:hypothetical protein
MFVGAAESQNPAVVSMSKVPSAELVVVLVGDTVTVTMPLPLPPLPPVFSSSLSPFGPFEMVVLVVIDDTDVDVEVTLVTVTVDVIEEAVVRVEVVAVVAVVVERSAPLHLADGAPALATFSEACSCHVKLRSKWSAFNRVLKARSRALEHVCCNNTLSRQTTVALVYSLKHYQQNEISSKPFYKARTLSKGVSIFRNETRTSNNEQTI